MNTNQPLGPEQTPPGGSQRTNPLANYQFSPEERRVLMECNRISFYERSLPLSGLLGALTVYGIKNGFLSPNPRFGVVPKVCAAVAIGYFVGKVSFQSKCAEMLMQIPNSRLAEILRQNKNRTMYGQVLPDQGFAGGLVPQPFSSSSNVDVYDDIKQRSSILNMDESRPTFSGLDDVYRPNLDSPPIANYDDLAPIETKPGVTYDELRKKNREDFYAQQQQQGPLGVNPPPNIYRPPVVRAPEPPSGTEGGQEQKRKNQYGDVWT